MVLLSNKEVDTIHDLLVQHGVSYDPLRMDLLDHICCMVEERMDRGDPFSKALSQSAADFGPQGFEKTQEETLYLLTLKLRKMKKLTSIIGIVGSVLTLIGILFKFMHWPGAGVALVLGMAAITILFLPFLMAVRLMEKQGNISRFITVTGIMAGMVFTVSVLFRIMHWPYSNMLLTGSLLWIAFVFIPGYFIRSYRMAENKLLTVANILVLFTGVFLLYRMTTLGASTEMQNSIYVMHQHLRNETVESHVERLEYIADQGDALPSNILDLAIATDSLTAFTERMRVNSIAMTQSVSLDKALEINLSAMSWGMSAGPLQEKLTSSYGPYDTGELRRRIENWKMVAIRNGVTEAQCNQWIDLGGMVSPYYGEMSWEEAHFEHATIVSLVTYLDQLNLEVNHRFLQLAGSAKEVTPEMVEG